MAGTSRPKNKPMRELAKVLPELPAPVRYKVLETVSDYLVSEGRERQLALTFSDAAPPEAQPPEKASRPKGRRKKLIAFGWYGGKFNHLNWLLPQLPEAHHYCEPFGGSAAVLLNRPPSPVETYNDLDGELVNFFRVLRDQTEDLIKAIALTPFSREEFQKAVSGPTDDLDGLERARRFFVRARQVRTGLAQTASIGRWANCKNTSRAGMAGAVSRWLGSIEGLPQVALRLLRVQFENRPAMEVIKLYDSPDTLFYCDPPYPHESRGDSKAYKYEMTEDQHCELAKLLRGVEGKVALSGYRCDLLETLYAGWRRVDAPTKNCHSIKKPRRGALWVNYDEAGTRLDVRPSRAVRGKVSASRRCSSSRLSDISDSATTPTSWVFWSAWAIAWRSWRDGDGSLWPFSAFSVSLR